MEEKESTLSGSSSGNTDSGGSPMPISSVVNMAVTTMNMESNHLGGGGGGGVSCSGGGGPASAPAPVSVGGFLDGGGGSGGGALGSGVGSGGMTVYSGGGIGGGGGGIGGHDLTMMGKKKRGRPRKYDLDGNLRPGYSSSQSPAAAVTPVMSPPPGFTLTPNYTSSAPAPSTKRGRGRSASSTANWQVLASLGEVFASTAGGDFTPHIVTVQTGEDVSAKILSFSQTGPRGICVLSANGAVSSVTLRQPGSAGGIMTYEGRLEIVSLTGSFTVSETAGMRSRSGGLSVTLAGPDGRVIGGGIAGLLTAASPIQVVVGTFMPNGYKPPKRKYTHREPTATATPVSEPATVPNSQAPPVPYREQNPPSASPSPLQAQHHDHVESEQGPGSRQNLNPVSHYGWNGSQNPVLGQKIYPDINMSAPAE